ncbi:MULTISPECIES: hypothetical protein [unclassified Streptomyces]|uniref:hypothetical protein n=1 Tax=unclassified Streptomyces TaxID=2593676 RepID=UPI0011CD7071|nr:hypothetical protein [Streptomyces sp. PanSC9]
MAARPSPGPEAQSTWGPGGRHHGHGQGRAGKGQPGRAGAVEGVLGQGAEDAHAQGDGPDT